MTDIILIFAKFLFTTPFVCQILINIIGLYKTDVKISLWLQMECGDGCLAVWLKLLKGAVRLSLRFFLYQLLAFITSTRCWESNLVITSDTVFPVCLPPRVIICLSLSRVLRKGSSCFNELLLINTTLDDDWERYHEIR